MRLTCPSMKPLRVSIWASLADQDVFGLCFRDLQFGFQLRRLRDFGEDSTRCDLLADLDRRRL